MTRFFIIPTRTLADGAALRLAAQIAPAGRPIIIAPEKPASVPWYVDVIVKRGATFSAWVNEGVEHALTVSSDARVIVINDDISTDPASMTRMFDALESADIVIEPGRGDLRTPSRLTGHLFGFRADRGLRLPEVDGLALWWFQTDWFYWDSVERGLTVHAVDGVKFDHHSDNDDHDGHWHYPPEFEWSVQADHDWFWSRFHYLDEAHRGCYLTWWGDALPEGQVHRTDWTS